VPECWAELETRYPQKGQTGNLYELLDEVRDDLCDLLISEDGAASVNLNLQDTALRAITSLVRLEVCVSAALRIKFLALLLSASFRDIHFPLSCLQKQSDTKAAGGSRTNAVSRRYPFDLGRRDCDFQHPSRRGFGQHPSTSTLRRESRSKV